MSHLQLVPQPADTQCECDHGYGRYWLHGSWHCTATDAVVRFYPTKGWHHYAAQHNTTSNLRALDMENAAA